MEKSYLVDYCQALSEQQTQVIKHLDDLISRWQPSLSARLWQSMGYSIIGYGVATYRAGGQDRSWFLIGLAAHKSYFSLYVWGIVEGRYLLEAQQAPLGRVKIGKACLNFKQLNDLNLPAIKTLIAKAVALQT